MIAEGKPIDHAGLFREVAADTRTQPASATRVAAKKLCVTEHKRALMMDPKELEPQNKGS